MYVFPHYLHTLIKPVLETSDSIRKFLILPRPIGDFEKGHESDQIWSISCLFPSLADDRHITLRLNNGRLTDLCPWFEKDTKPVRFDQFRVYFSHSADNRQTLGTYFRATAGLYGCLRSAYHRDLLGLRAIQVAYGTSSKEAYYLLRNLHIVPSSLRPTAQTYAGIRLLEISEKLDSPNDIISGICLTDEGKSLE